MSIVCKIRLNDHFKSSQNFWTFLHMLDMFEGMENFFHPKDVVSTERREIEGHNVIVIKLSRYEYSESYDLFCFKADDYVSSQELAQAFFYRIKELFAEEFI